MTHDRFNRKVWASKSDFTGALAKWLVRQSPYTVPDNLSICIEKFDKAVDKGYKFDENGIVEIGLLNLTDKTNQILEEIPEIMILNERKNGREGMGFSSRYSKDPEPDDDFIDIMALAQNITCDFADRADAQCWLDKDKEA
jgi:hypothetical protein